MSAAPEGMWWCEWIAAAEDQSRRLGLAIVRARHAIRRRLR